MRHDAAFLLILLSANLWGAEVLKVSEQSDAIAISNEEAHAWHEDDKVCVLQNHKKIACGVVIKVRTNGAIVKLSKHKKPVVAGDPVHFSDRDLASVSTSDAAYDGYHTKSGVGLGFSFGGSLGALSSQTTTATATTTGRTGFMAGASLEIPLSSHFFLQPEVNYSQKGATIIASPTITADLSYNYLEFPFLLKIKWLKGRFKLVTIGGPYVAYLVNGSGTTTISGTVSAPTDLKSTTNSLDFGAYGGLGGDIDFGKGVHGTFMARYGYGVANISNVSTTVSRIAALQLLTGLTFVF